MTTARVVVQVADQRVLLSRVLAATTSGTACAVLDPTWPREVLNAAHAAIDEAAARGRLRGGDLAVFTSGSTAHPRPVVRGVRSWLASVEPLREVLGVRPSDTVWLPGPLWSSLFLYGAWHASVLGLRTVLRDEDPRAGSVVHCVPAQVPDVLQRYLRGEVPGLRLLVVAGDRLPDDLRRRAEREGLRVVEYYGAAELSFVAWRDDDGPLRAFPGVGLDVREDVLWVRSPYLARDCLGRIDGPFRQDDEGWATVGDLASERDEGVEVLGRGTSAITTGGHTVVAEDVERHLHDVPGLRDVAVVGLPHPRLGQLVVAVVVGDVDDGSLRSAAGRLPSPARPRRWLRSASLPRSESGKLLREEAARLAVTLALR